MISTKYSEAAVDVLDIFEHMEEEDQKKVPKKFIDILKENASKEYVCNLDYTKRLVEMDLSLEARSILGVMYRHYWCPEEKKADFEKRVDENEIEFQRILSEKYNPDEIFKNTGSILSEEKVKADLNLEKNETSLVEVKEEGIFQKFINKILTIFKK